MKATNQTEATGNTANQNNEDIIRTIAAIAPSTEIFQEIYGAYTGTAKKDKSHFAKIPREIIRNEEITAATEHIYAVLVDLADYKTRIAEVTALEIAKTAHKSTRTVRRRLSILVQSGVIVRLLRKDPRAPKHNMPNLYFIRDGEALKKALSRDDTGAKPASETTTCPKMATITAKNVREKDIRENTREESLESNLKGEAELPENSDNSEKTQNPVTPAVNTEPPAVPTKPETPKTSKQSEPDLSGVPEIMRPVAKYLLDETGRTELHPGEYEVIREIEKRHMPIRVMKEIDKRVAQYKRKGKNLHMLNFYCLAKPLLQQVSRKPKSAQPTGNADMLKSTPEVENAREVMTDVTSEILPAGEAEKIISEYTPAVKERESIPAALEELYGKIAAKGDEITIEDYLRLKFPDAEESELLTWHLDSRKLADLEEAVIFDKTCASCSCGDGHCPLGKFGERPKSRPVAVLKETMNSRNHKRRLIVGWTTYLHCKHNKAKPDPEFERRVKQSGLSERQSKQTFASYKHEGMPEEIVSAKAKAILAAKNNTSLILAGKAGTGKTHLAAAIALEVMRGGKQALFRTVPDLLDELARAEWGHADSFGLRQMFRDVPCLVLDDLGKEKTTDKRMEYLFGVLDYRYSHGLQTIVTTNALNMGGLVNQWNADKVEPLVSRIVENGEWVTIRNADNYRLLA